MRKYELVSKTFREILRSYDDKFESIGLCKAFLNITGKWEGKIGTGISEQLAIEIWNEVKDEL